MNFQAKPDKCRILGTLQVVHEGKCRKYGCSNTVQATVRNMLAQKDVGSDYEMGADGGAARCSECGMGMYVSFLCRGEVSAFEVGFYA